MSRIRTLRAATSRTSAHQRTKGPGEQDQLSLAQVAATVGARLSRLVVAPCIDVVKGCHFPAFFRGLGVEGSLEPVSRRRSLPNSEERSRPTPYPTSLHLSSSPPTGAAVALAVPCPPANHPARLHAHQPAPLMRRSEAKKERTTFATATAQSAAAVPAHDTPDICTTSWFFSSCSAGPQRG